MAKQIYLSRQDYKNAVRNLRQCATNKKLKNAVVDQNYANPGGYSIVFRIAIDQQQMALRCWHKNPGAVQERYPIIIDYLNKNRLPYFVEFDYISNALKYKGLQPVSWMEWVEGPTLDKFIDENINDPKKLLKIAELFLEMTRDLHKLNIAHGDLQSENIKVCNNDGQISLKLIDYDSLYVPTLPDNLLDELPGVSTFQHPKRFTTPYNQIKEKADYFSELVIYLSLVVYSKYPNLWRGVNDNEKKLLFEASDFENPNTSLTFANLKVSTSPQIKLLIQHLWKFCKFSPLDLIPLEDVVANETNVHKKASDFPAFFKDVSNSGSPKGPRITRTRPTTSLDFNGYFKGTSQKKRKQPENSNDVDIFDDYFKPSQPLAKSVKPIIVWVCPNGHKTFNSAEIYCSRCNNTSSFFGASQQCPSCNTLIPKRKGFRFCPECGKQV